MTKQQYIEYLVATPVNYTCTNLADHLEGGRSATTPPATSRAARGSPPAASLIFDDSVQDKRYSHRIEMVKR